MKPGWLCPSFHITFRYLLSHGADVFCRDYRDATPRDYVQVRMDGSY